MSSDWDNTFGSASNDPFGVSGDVFGRDLGEVDPFGGHDSFDGDSEWNHFNNLDERPSATLSPRQNSSDTGRSSSSRSKDSPRKKKGRKPEGSSRKLAVSSRKLMVSSGSSASKPKESSRGRSRDEVDDHQEEDGRNRSNSRTRPRSRSRSNSSGPGGREASHTTNAGKYRSTKAAHRERRSILKSSETTDAFGNGGTSGDPFEFGGSGDGFADFGAFPSSNNIKNNDDGFGSFGDFGETTGRASDELSPPGKQRRPPRQRSAASRESSFDEDQFARKQQSFRRSSIGSGTTSLNNSIHTSASSSAGSNIARFRHSRNRNGAVTRTRPSEQHSRIMESNERRSAIKDSLLGALGGNDGADGKVSLGNFLGDHKTRDGVVRRASDSHSIHSAPAAIRPPRQSRRAGRSLGNDSDNHSAGSEPHLQGKSRRYQRKMAAVATPTRESSKEGGTLKLDIAALVEQGYIEVQDGKMRLVIDVDTDTY